MNNWFIIAYQPHQIMCIIGKRNEPIKLSNNECWLKSHQEVSIDVWTSKIWRWIVGKIKIQYIHHCNLRINLSKASNIIQNGDFSQEFPFLAEYIWSFPAKWACSEEHCIPYSPILTTGTLQIYFHFHCCVSHDIISIIRISNKRFPYCSIQMVDFSSPPCILTIGEAKAPLLQFSSSNLIVINSNVWFAHLSNHYEPIFICISLENSYRTVFYSQDLTFLTNINSCLFDIVCKMCRPHFWWIYFPEQRTGRGSECQR